MLKFTVTIIETVEYSAEIEAPDADTARATAQQQLVNEGLTAFEFGGVIDRTLEVEEAK